MQHGAILGRIDVYALPHGIDPRAQADRIARAKSLASAISSSRWREKSMRSPDRSRDIRSKTLGIALEQLLHRHRRETRGVGAQIRPHRRARTGTCSWLA